jgi:hypothetical protein
MQGGGRVGGGEESTHFFALAPLAPFDHSADSASSFFAFSEAALLAAASAFLALPETFLVFSPFLPAIVEALSFGLWWRGTACRNGSKRVERLAAQDSQGDKVK